MTFAGDDSTSILATTSVITVLATLVDGTGVAVGGTDVTVGDTGVAVGGTDVTVGDTGVAVGGTDVVDAAPLANSPLTPNLASLSSDNGSGLPHAYAASSKNTNNKSNICSILTRIMKFNCLTI